MTDYKHFPRIPRPLPEIRANRLFVVLVIILILGAMSMAGKADMRAAQVIDQQEALERVKRNLAAEEARLFADFTERAK